MAYVISDACIACGACEGECPVSAITNAGSKFAINAGDCVDCGACTGACPVNAISAG